MSTNRSRRSVLQASGLAVAAGLAGCSFLGGGSGTPSPGRSYDVEVKNGITAGDLAGAAYSISAGTKTTVRVTVDRVRDEGDNEVLFDERLELEAGGTRTFEDAFGTETGGDPYAVNAVLFPFTEDAKATDEVRAGFIFLPGEYNTPADSTITVRTVDTRDDNVFNPEVRIDEAGPPES